MDRVNLTQIGMVLYKNGRIVNTGVGAAALGNPAACVAWLANKLFEFDITLKAGEVILSEPCPPRWMRNRETISALGLPISAK